MPNEGEPLKPFKFTRRNPGPKDVHMQITNCGVCHSDLHTVRVATIYSSVNYTRSADG